MSRPTLASIVGSVVLAFGAPLYGNAQSLSSALGATKLDGLKDMTDCMNVSHGYRERIIGERMAAKLAISSALNAEERAIWQADVDALKATTPQSPFVPPKQRDPQHYLLGLTDSEQQALNSTAARYLQEVNLECEKKYGGMTRYSPGSDQSGQKRYEEQLRAKMTTAIDVATVPLEALPSPFPKTREQVAAERQAAQQAQRAQQRAAAQAASAGAIAQITECQAKVKHLRLDLQADYMQRDLDSKTGLSAPQRSEYEADIRSVREAAAAGLDMPAPVDPANPARAMMRLGTEQQMAMGTEYGQKMMAELMACQAPR
jgi:hypothetical protein